MWIDSASFDCRKSSSRSASSIGRSETFMRPIVVSDESAGRRRSTVEPDRFERTHVSNLVLYTLVSLDGATEDPHRYFPETPNRPGAPVFDDELGRLEQDMIARQGAALLGRRTYDQWSRYWPTSDEQPFADFINAVAKYVVTSTPLEGTWNNAHAVSGSLAQIVSDVKGRTDGDVGVHASITLAQAPLSSVRFCSAPSSAGTRTSSTATARRSSSATSRS
jgi:dihydrofolate reductase